MCLSEVYTEVNTDEMVWHLDLLQNDLGEREEIEWTRLATADNCGSWVMGTWGIPMLTTLFLKSEMFKRKNKVCV